MLLASLALALTLAPVGAPASPAPGGPRPKPTVVDVVAREYAFTMPDSIPAGLVTIQLRNEGKQLHHFWMVRLTEGRTFADLMSHLKAHPEQMPAWAVNIGGPQPPAPGGSSNATLLLTPGRYAVLCVVPGPDGVPHVAKGMSHPLAVTESAAERVATEAAAGMKPDLQVRLVDYGFEFSKPLSAGEHTIRVQNDASQFHEIVIFKLLPGKSLADALTWVEKQQGPPPLLPVGGITGLDKGQHALMQERFTPGEYAVVCFLPDAKDGKPHFTHGMATQLKVE
ncbi:MAG TPA: hypothetical protein VFS40_06370 [Gemmatimonadales bacterium]|nr:hypothetical protein [Gemmatimonadales bacterium]